MNGKENIRGPWGGKDTSPREIIILGVGNLLMADEGVGVHVAEELMKMDLPEGVRVVEGGTDGFKLLNVILGASKLIIIDAVKAGEAPGTIYRFTLEEAPSFPDIYKTSVHQIGILEVVNLSSLVGDTPETIIIGIEPKAIKMGMDLSPEIESKLPRIIEIVMDEVRK